MARPLPARILIVDDDPEIRELLCSYLEGFGMRTRRSQRRRAAFGAGPRALRPDPAGPHAARAGRPRVYVAEIRRDSDVPIVMVTGRGEASDRIVGLELGADDYLVKPFDERELVARIGAVLRRGRHRGRSAPKRPRTSPSAAGGSTP